MFLLFSRSLLVAMEYGVVVVVVVVVEEEEEKEEEEGGRKDCGRAVQCLCVCVCVVCVRQKTHRDSSAHQVEGR